MQATIGIVNLIIAGNNDADLRLLYFFKTDFSALYISLSNLKMPQNAISSVRQKIKQHRSDGMQEGLCDIVENQPSPAVLRKTAIKGGSEFSSYAGIETLMLCQIGVLRLQPGNITFMNANHFFQISYMHLG